MSSINSSCYSGSINVDFFIIIFCLILTGYLYNENTINQQLDYLKTEIEETIVILKKAKFFSKGYFFQFFVQNYIDTVIINYLPQFRVFPFLLLVWFF